MKYVSVRKGKGAALILALLLLLVFALGVLSLLGIIAPGPLQIMMLVICVVIVKLTERYLLTGYEYILDPIDEIAERNRITVIKTVGQKRTSVYTAPLFHLSEVVRFGKYSDTVQKYGEISERIELCPDIFPAESYLLVFEVNGEVSTVRIECDASFAREIEKRVGI